MRLIRLGIAPVVLAGLAAAAAAAQDTAAPPAVIASPPPEAPPAPMAQPAPEVLSPVPMTQAPAPPTPAPEVPPLQAAPPPPAPYRRCSQLGRGFASIGSCALRVVPGQVTRLQIRLERDLPARPGAIVLVWREREDSGGVIYRISGRALGANPGQRAGTILSVSVAGSYCAPSNRAFDVELELEDGRNLGLIGRFTFPCSG